MRIRAILGLCGAVLLFLVIGLAWISLPGAYQDEMLFLNGAFTNNPIVSVPGFIRIFKHDVPTMLMPYVGATKGLLWRLVFLLWAPSIYSARVPIVLLGALALVVFFFWARRYYSPGTAATAALLAGADPTYIFTARLDWGPVVIQRLLAATGLLLAARWVERTEQDKASSGANQAAEACTEAAASESGAAAAVAAQRAHGPRMRPATATLAWLAAAGFCFGLGVWDKTSFAWFLIALGIALLVLFPRDVLRRLRPLPVAVFVLALCAGAFPLIRYNLSTNSGKTYYAVHTTFSPSEIIDKASKLAITADGRAIYGWTAGWAFDPEQAEARAQGIDKLLASVAHAGPPWGTLFPWVLGLAAVVLCFARGKRRQIAFPLLIAAIMWAQVLPLKEGGGAHHFVLAYPFPHLAIAAAAAWAWERLRGALRLIAVVVVAAAIITMLGWDARTLWLFRETGGAWNWSDASYDITRYLEQRKPKVVMCMDWGFSYPLLLLSQGRLNEQDFFADVAFSPPEEAPKHVQRLIPLLLQPGRVYLFHAGGYQAFRNVREVFEEALKQVGMHEQVIATFKQRKGDNLAILSEVVPGSGPEAKTIGETFAFSITPDQVRPGDHYTIECAALAGKQIDLLYVRGADTAEEADQFTRLDASGKAVIKVPLAIPRGVVQVIAVRESDTRQWHPASAKIIVK